MHERVANAKASEIALGAIAICLLIVVAAYSLVLRPSGRHVEALRTSLAEAKGFVAEAQDYINRDPERVVEAGHLYTFDTLPALPTELAAAAKAANVVVTAIRIGNATPVQLPQESDGKSQDDKQKQSGTQKEKSRLMKVSVSVTAKAAYGALVEFLTNIEKMPRHVTVTDLDVTAPTGEETAALGCKAEMDILVYDPSGRSPTEVGPGPDRLAAAPGPKEPFRTAPAEVEGSPSEPGGFSSGPGGFQRTTADEPPSGLLPPLIGPEEPSTPSEQAASSRSGWPLALPRIVTPGRPVSGLAVRQSLGADTNWPHLAGTIRGSGQGIAVVESGGTRLTFTEGAELAPGVKLANVDAGQVTIQKQPLLRGERDSFVVRVGEPLRGVTIQAPGSVPEYPQIVCILQGDDGPVAVVREGEQAYMVRPGDVLAGGVSIKRIDADAVVMEAHGDELRLAVPTLAGSAKPNFRTGAGVQLPATAPSPSE